MMAAQNSNRVPNLQFRSDWGIPFRPARRIGSEFLGKRYDLCTLITHKCEDISWNDYAIIIVINLVDLLYLRTMNMMILKKEEWDLNSWGREEWVLNFWGRGEWDPNFSGRGEWVQNFWGRGEWALNFWERGEWVLNFWGSEVWDQSS